VIATLRQLYEVVRPSGRRQLVGALSVVVLQALLQTLAVFSLAPFLSAAANIALFRASAPGRLFERVFGNGTDQRLLLAAALTSAVLLIGGNAFSLVAEVARSRYAQAVGRRLRSEMLRALLQRKYSYFLGINTSLLTKHLIEDVSSVALQVLMPVLDIISRILLVIFLVATVVWFEPLVVIGGGLVVALYYLLVMRPIRRSAGRASGVIKDEVRRLYFEVQQLLGGIKPIFATDQRSYFIRRVEKASQELTREVGLLPVYISVPRVGLEMVMFGSMIGWVVALVLTGNDLAGAVPRIGLIAVVAYRLMPSIQLIFANMGAVTAAQQSLEEVIGLMREQAAYSSGAAAEEAVPLAWQREIRLDGVTFRYPGADAPALDGVSLAIARGSRVAFVGPTGSGKSTLIDLLLGLHTPTGGAVLVDDRSLLPVDLPSWRRTVGYVPQDLFLLDGTIAENIAFGHEAAHIDRARVLKVARIAQAEFIASRSDLGIDSLVGERGVKLSGGQRQRLALARALYPGPTVLVMDEATSALDPVTERKVVDALRRGDGADVTVITVAHRISTIRDYDVIHYLEHGRVLFSGRYDDLVASQEAFRAFVAGSH